MEDSDHEIELLCKVAPLEIRLILEDTEKGAHNGNSGPENENSIPRELTNLNAGPFVIDKLRPKQPRLQFAHSVRHKPVENWAHFSAPIGTEARLERSLIRSAKFSG
jgi:hypothetical protein